MTYPKDLELPSVRMVRSGSSVALKVMRNGYGSVSSTPAGITCGYYCSTTFFNGTSVTLIATPEPNRVFSGWGGDCSGTGSCKMTMSVPKTVTANFISSAADCVFNWAERAYQLIFPSTNATSGTLAPYYYRYYPRTATYLATSASDDHIWVLGPASGNSLLDVGPISNFSGTAGCSQ